MRGSLGEKIGEGATADIHAWAPGQVLKLFKAGITPRLARHEARMTRAVFAAGGPAPEVLDEVTVEGRFGIMLPRLDGPTLRQLLLTRAMTAGQACAILATLYTAVHKTPPPPAAPSVRDWWVVLSRIPGAMPKHIATGILTLIERLAPADSQGDVLCHADLHPANVIMTPDGPRIIDWLCTVHAPAAYDLGRCYVLLCELVPEGIDPERPRAMNAAVQSEYARLAGMAPAALTAAMQSHLPILRGFAIAESATNPARRKRLIQSVEAMLRSESRRAGQPRD